MEKFKLEIVNQVEGQKPYIKAYFNGYENIKDEIQTYINDLDSVHKCNMNFNGYKIEAIIYPAATHTIEETLENVTGALNKYLN